MVLPLLIAAAGMAAAGKLMQGIGANAAAKSRAKALEVNAQMDLDEAGVAASLGLEEDARAQGRLAVLAGSGSGGGAQGSALNVLDDLQRQSLFKTRSTAYRGQTSAWSRRNDATIARREGKAALISSVFSAGSTVLGAFAQNYEAARGASAAAGGGGGGGSGGGGGGG